MQNPTVIYVEKYLFSPGWNLIQYVAENNLKMKIFLPPPPKY